MIKWIKNSIHPFLKKGYDWYYSKPRKYQYKNIEVVVQPTVFHPYLVISTKILLEFIEELNLNGKTFLELGCGSGIISILAAKKGAIVTASDINESALVGLKESALNNNVVITIKHSDLFDDLEGFYDYIIINPPYFPKEPQNIAENAWFCGSNFEYFSKLFLQLSHFLNKEMNVYMILAETCDINQIKSLASEHYLALEMVVMREKLKEKNWIYRIKQYEK